MEKQAVCKHLLWNRNASRKIWQKKVDPNEVIQYKSEGNPTAIFIYSKYQVAENLSRKKYFLNTTSL